MNPARARARALALLSCSSRCAADARRLSSGRMHQVNWFAVLGVQPTASQAEIKAAFRQHAKIMHPDVAPSSSHDSVEQFKLISEAYGYLKDDSLRLQLAQRFAQPRSATSASASGGPGSFYNPRSSARQGDGAGYSQHQSANHWEYYRQQARSDPFNGPFSRYNTQDDPPPPKHMG